MKAQDLPANFGGCSSETEQVAAVRTKYEELCAAARSDRKSKEESEKAALECFSAFILLRSTANAWIHRDDKIEEMTDQKTLVDILIGSIGAGDIDRFEAAAVRMRQLAPDMYEPLKANIVAKVMRASQVAETDESKVSDYMSLLERDLAAATTIPNSDPELQEALIMSRTRLMKDHGRMEDVVDELRRSGQKGPVLAYYEAAVLWHKGEHKKVIETMRDLSRQFPNETRYSETLENLLKDPEGKDSKGHFISRLSVHFDLTGDLKDLKVEQ